METGLEFFSNEELIHELFNRRTFAGIIVYSSTPHKFDDQKHTDIKLVTSADVDSTVFLLETGLIAVKGAS